MTDIDISGRRLFMWAMPSYVPHSLPLAAGFAIIMAAIVAGCDDRNAPYVEIEGGGFIFNYRIGEVFYGISVKPMRKLAKGTVIEAELEDPAGGPAHVVREVVASPRLAYSLQSPPLRGVRKDHPYRVTVRVLEAGTGKELARLEHALKSELDQSILPEQPLTIGPGYMPNPATQTPQ